MDPKLKRCVQVLLAVQLLSLDSSLAEEQSPDVAPTVTIRGRLEQADEIKVVIKENAGNQTYPLWREVDFARADGVLLTPEEGRSKMKAGTKVRLYFLARSDAKLVRRVEIEN